MTDLQINSHATLYAKLARVMARMERLPKNGFNRHFKYSYVLDEDVADAVRGALAAENVAFLPSIAGLVREGDRTLLEMDFLFACGDTGATITMTWRGEAVDKGDKGVSKAATLAQKYFLLKTFILSAGDDADPDSQFAEHKHNSPAGARASGSPPAKKPATQTSTANGNGRPAIRTARWAETLQELASQTDYYNEDGKINPYHVLGSLAKAGWTGDITDDNADEALRVLLVYAADEEKLEEVNG